VPISVLYWPDHSPSMMNGISRMNEDEDKEEEEELKKADWWDEVDCLGVSI
jgi:hypothetical protein